jgi:hypothetical protein
VAAPRDTLRKHITECFSPMLIEPENARAYQDLFDYVTDALVHKSLNPWVVFMSLIWLSRLVLTTSRFERLCTSTLRLIYVHDKISLESRVTFILSWSYLALCVLVGFVLDS